MIFSRSLPNPDILWFLIWWRGKPCSLMQSINEDREELKRINGNLDIWKFQWSQKIILYLTFTPTSFTEAVWLSRFDSLATSSVDSSSFSLCTIVCTVLTIFFSSSGYGVGYLFKLPSCVIKSNILILIKSCN